jgi:redox-sensitive bicupin YhaK (pirin superfamily)
MIDVVPFEALGRMNIGWLDAHYHFSFAEYYDPARMGFGPLRVWNDDRIRPGGAFPMHPHRDFEIITTVRRGAVTHEDSMGNKGRIDAGHVQVMTAGTGIVHSESNAGDEDLELFQIWVVPCEDGLTPSWETRAFAPGDRAGRLVTLASGRGAEGDAGALPIHQDVALLAADLDAGQSVVHRLEAGRGAYLVPTRGAVEVNGTPVQPRAGVAVAGEDSVVIRAIEDAEVVLMDLRPAAAPGAPGEIHG